jgi:hypothetical protein
MAKEVHNIILQAIKVVPKLQLILVGCEEAMTLMMCMWLNSGGGLC